MVQLESLKIASKTIFPGGSDGKVSLCSAGNLGLIPGLRRSTGGGNGSPLQYSYLGNPTDTGAWWAKVHGVTKESDMTEQLNSNIIYAH